VRGPPLLGSRPEVRGFLGQTRKLRQKRSSPTIDSACVWPYNSIASWGAVAQLGERVNGIHEVVGSIPISSTWIKKGPGIPGAGSLALSVPRGLSLKAVMPLDERGSL
jgi:hypothetical protein